MNIVKNSSFQKVSSKTDITIEFSVFFYILQHRSKLIFDIFSKVMLFCKRAPLICPQGPTNYKQYKNIKNVKNDKIKIFKNLSFWKVSCKTDITIEFSAFLNVLQHRSKLIFDIFWKMSFFDIEIIKNCMFLMF